MARLARRAGPDINLRAKRLLTGIAWLAASSYAFIIVTFYPSPQFWLGATLPQLTTWFAAGMAIAVVTVWAQAEPGPDGPVRRFCRTVGFSSGACWLIAALVFAIACTPITGPEGIQIPDIWSTEMRAALYTIVAGVVVATAAFQPPGQTRFNRLLGHRVMRFLGKISYGVFLWQFLIIFAFFNLMHLKDNFHGGTYTTIDVIGLTVAVGLLTVAASAAGYFCIERPVLRLSHRTRRQPHGRHSTPALPARRTAAMAEGGASPGPMLAQPDSGAPPGVT